VLVTLTPLGPLLQEKFSRINLLQTASWRLFSWAKAFSVFREHPLFGVGLGYQHQFYRLSADMQGVLFNTGNTIHNDGLWVLVNTGLLGFCVLVITLLALFRAGFSTVRLTPVPAVAALNAACLGGFAVLTITAMFQPTFSLGSSGVMVGVLAAVLHRGRDLETNPSDLPPRHSS